MPSGNDSQAAHSVYSEFRKHDGVQKGWHNGSTIVGEQPLDEAVPMFSNHDDPAAEYKEIKQEAKIEFKQMKESATQVYERNMALAREQFEMEVERTRERFEKAKLVARESLEKSIAGARDEYQFAKDIAKDQLKEWKRETRIVEKERKKSGA